LRFTHKRKAYEALAYIEDINYELGLVHISIYVTQNKKLVFSRSYGFLKINSQCSICGKILRLTEITNLRLGNLFLWEAEKRITLKFSFACECKKVQEMEIYISGDDLSDVILENNVEQKPEEITF